MKKIILKDEIYSKLKWILAVAVGPTISLIEGLGELYHFDAHYITITIGLVATFLGALIGYSNYNYKNAKNNEEDSEIAG